MAITMSSATIDTSERDSLLSSEVDGSVANGGATANTQGTGLFGTSLFGSTEATGAKLAGVTASFATNVSAKIDEYKASVKTELDRLQDVESSVAFQGEAVKAALTQFIDSVRTVAESYLTKLEAAEKQIISSVDTAYSTQDTDLSSNMNSDAGTLGGNTI